MESEFWTPELIAETAIEWDRGYNLLYGPESKIWDGEKWVPRRQEAVA
jgi:hypothetical protein